jgi:hypothetical protein
LKGTEMPAFMMNGVAAANPSVGKQVLMSPFSGPKGSPFDAKKANYTDPNDMTRVADPDNLSTGALCTGIGFGLNDFDGFVDKQPGRVLPDQNFTDDYTPGVTMPAGTSALDARLTCIGGGGSLSDGTPDPYDIQPLLGFGGGGARDAGTGPAYTGFATKTVTATGAVAVGAAVETGFVNRTSYALEAGKTVFGAATTASPEVIKAN